MVPPPDSLFLEGHVFPSCPASQTWHIGSGGIMPTREAILPTPQKLTKAQRRWETSRGDTGRKRTCQDGHTGPCVGSLLRGGVPTKGGASRDAAQDLTPVRLARPTQIRTQELKSERNCMASPPCSQRMWGRRALTSISNEASTWARSFSASLLHIC